MSVTLASTGSSRVRVRTLGANPPNEHEPVFIDDEVVMMDDFCNMVKQFVGGNMALQAGPYIIDYLNPVWAWSLGTTGGFTMSTEDFYQMIQYVLTNTDIYIPLDPRPGLYQWLTEQVPGRDEHHGRFIRRCVEGGVVMGHNAGGVCLQI